MTIILLVAVLLLPFLDVIEVTIMEARNFITAREMLTDGHWILTTMNGEARYQKPPLPTWLTALSAMVFGIKSVWGLRLPAVLMVMLLGSLLYTLSRKLTLDKSHSLYNGLIGVTSLYVILIVLEAPWDIYAHTFTLVAIYGIVRVFSATETSWRYILLVIVGIGCSVLSKGPVSVYGLLLPFLIAYGIIFRKSTTSKKWIQLSGILVLGLALGFSWYLYVRYADPETFAAITAKETGNWTSYNVRPFYYYWSFFTQSGLWTIPAFIGLLYPYLKTRVSNLKVYQFTLLWTLLVVVLLSVIPEKKSRYLMPVLIPLAMNTGFYIEYLIRRFKALTNKRETLPVYVAFGLIGLAFVGVSVFAIYLLFTETPIEPPVVTYVFIGLLSVIGILLLKKLYQKSIEGVILLLMSGLMIVVYTLGPLHIKNKEASKDHFDFDGFFKGVGIEHTTPIYAYKNTSPEMVWARGDKIPVIEELSELKEGDTFYIFDCQGCEEGIEDSEYISKFKYDAPYFIDLNYEGLDYKDRKVGYIYKLIKRE
ncbi:ArnT family glycosyltransferase [Dokdonia ponticola]|uniref:ArnT family glycosyltransferase n=1 Tax=Dokdonia ponticola TaxID=2041041 RepID=A0ABV9HVW1_9FLAO